MSKYLFLLGREPELSLAELLGLFPSVKKQGMFAFVESEREFIPLIASLGGTIKAGKVLAENVSKADLDKICVQCILPTLQPEKKTRIAVDAFVSGLNNLVFKIKDTLKTQWHSIRVVQHDNGRVKTATTLHEKLIERGCELIILTGDTGYTVAQTMWVQDIDAYTRRDINRERSMSVGMMPPKLAQIMINLATKGERELQVWDAFCGLGTTLIEASHMGHTSLLGSDISDEMVVATKSNTAWLQAQNIEIFHHDARRIDTKKVTIPTVIVTEWMLGHNFTPGTLTHTSAIKERSLLESLYREFFASAFRNTSIESIVCCLPVWNIGRESIYMPTHTVLAPDWKLDPLCQSQRRYLLHARPGQSVTREILMLRRGQ
jgi:tRNA G10  N-methylase Trm11